MFGVRYDTWARELVRTRPRLAGLYLVGVGGACFGFLSLVFRATGIGYVALVPFVCITFGGWMALFGSSQKGPETPAWYRVGAVAMIMLAVVATFTATSWLPVLLAP
ncbi:MAG: hypothetical protein IPK71_36385 [Myxococcales bacterium]|jgi:hypothetical protein|nr:hypothetical protein [Myxococcales bacterium]